MQLSTGGFETSFDLSNKLNGSGDFDENNVGAGESSRILDDPFDAEWAALATRNNTKNTNPFKSDAAVVGDDVGGGGGGGEQDFKAFELQM